MNTPTHAQALGEAPALKPQMPDTWSRSEIAMGSCPDGSFVQYSQHRAIVEDLRRQHGQHFAGIEAEANNARRTAEYWKAEHLAANEKLEAAEARVRETERLLRECITHRNPLTRSTDELVDDIRALLAARG